MVKVRFVVSQIDKGFATLVSDCHHVLEFPTALLPEEVLTKQSVVTFDIERSIICEKTRRTALDGVQKELLNRKEETKTTLVNRAEK